MRYLSYLHYILLHKWYVMVECFKMGLCWQGIVHDLSKFLPSEFFPYAHFFHKPDGSTIKIKDETGYYKPYETEDEAFKFAWLLHQKRNRHHWQWWLLPRDEGGWEIFPMPDKYRKEMICDWRGAGKTKGGNGTDEDLRRYYLKHKDEIHLHPETREWVEKQLNIQK